MKDPATTSTRKALALVFSLVLSATASAQEPLIVDGKPFFTALGPQVSVLQDPTGSLTVADVMSPALAPRFEPTGAGIPSFGFTRAAVWVRFEIASRATRDETVLLELGMSRLSRFSWYVADGADPVEYPATTSHGARPASRFPTMALHVPAGERRTIYARAESDTAIWLPMVAATPLAFAEQGARRDFGDFAHAGFCLALALLGLGFWAADRRSRLFLSLGAAMCGALLYFSIFNGLYAWLGGPWPDWMGRPGILLSALLFSVMFTKFTQDFLGWNRLPPGVKRLFTASYVATAGMMILCLVLPYALAVKLAQMVQLVTFVLAACASLHQALVRRGRGMGLFALAWVVLLSGTLLFYLQLNGLFPLASVSPYDALRFVFSSVFFVFLLAGASAQGAALQTAARVARLHRAETEARLDALRHQLNPHFLFNTLASIEELSHEAPSRIPELVGRLANFLRLRLKPDPSEAVPLSRELAAVRDYLGIEQVRFEEKLKASYDIDPGAEACMVPELVLVPLVENAVKHGFADAEVQEIRISARRNDRQLVLRVENTGVLRRHAPSPRSTGVGTRNLRTRLRLRYRKAAHFSLRQEGAMVVAEVRLPVAESGHETGDVPHC